MLIGGVIQGPKERGNTYLTLATTSTHTHTPGPGPGSKHKLTDRAPHRGESSSVQRPVLIRVSRVPFSPEYCEKVGSNDTHLEGSSTGLELRQTSAVPALVGISRAPWIWCIRDPPTAALCAPLLRPHRRENGYDSTPLKPSTGPMPWTSASSRAAKSSGDESKSKRSSRRPAGRLCSRSSRQRSKRTRGESPR